MRRRLVLILVMVGLALGWQARPVAAQATVPSDQTEQAVLQKQSLTAEIIQLETIYRGQLTEYRLAEKEFQIARDQYFKLQTLASINTVVEAAQKVFKLRTQVMLTYFELLRVNLIAAEGVEVSLKQIVVNRIEEQKQWLQSHQGVVSTADDREKLNELADAFTGKQESFENVSQEAVSLLSVGKLQNVFDRLVLITKDLSTQEASNSAVTQARAMRETNRLIEETSTNLRELGVDLNTGITKNEVRSLYEGLSRTLDPIYANLNKLVSFLDELLGSL